MYRRSLSVPSSPRTRRSCPQMDWTRTMIKSICASCSDWETGHKRVNPCTRVSRHYSRSWDFRSNSSQTKMRYGAIRKASIPKMADTSLMHKSKTVMDHGDGPDELHLTLCMMRRLKAQERSDRVELRCRASISVNDPCWTFDRQRELQRERLKRRSLILHLRNRRHCRLGGIG